MTQKKAWQKSEGESQKAFEAFEIYCQTESGRSYSRVAQKLNKSRTLIARWAGQYDWVERTTAFDDWKNDQRLQTLETKIEKSAEKEVDVWVSRRFDVRHSEFELGKKLVALAMRGLEAISNPSNPFFEKKTVTTKDGKRSESTTTVPGINHLEKIARVMEIGLRWQRNSCDMPTETFGHTLSPLAATGEDYATLDADARQKLRERYAQEEKEILEYCQREGIEIDI